MVTEIATLSEFNKCIEDNPKVAVDFTATWCGPCKMIGPVFKAAAADYPDIKCIIVDVDENSDTSKKCGISAMPTFKFFHNGNEVEDLCLVGASEDKLKGNFEKVKNLRQFEWILDVRNLTCKDETNIPNIRIFVKMIQRIFV